MDATDSSRQEMLTCRKHVDPSHLKRFHNDPQTHLTGYGIHYGDERMEGGEPIPTGTLRGLAKSTTHIPPAQNFGDSYEIRTGAPLAPFRGALATGSLPHPSPESGASRRMGGTAIPYSTGTFVAESGLPPTQYKSWSSEYRDEYRSIDEKAQNLKTMTMTHGTADALKSSQFQFSGYPFSSKTYSRSSLGAKGQLAPDYESRVVGF